MATKLYFNKILENTNAPAHSKIAVSHGFLGSSANWLTVSRKLCSHPGLKDRIRELFALDMRNHGKSPHTGHHSASWMASDLEKFVRDTMTISFSSSSARTTTEAKEDNSSRSSSPSRGGGGGLLIGHSMGGVVVMTSLYRHVNAAAIAKAASAASTTAPSPSSSSSIVSVENAAMQWPLGEDGGRLEDGDDDVSSSSFDPFRRRTAATSPPPLRSSSSPPPPIAAAIIVDISPVQQTPDAFRSIQENVRAMRDVPLHSIASHGDADKYLKTFGVTDAAMRGFLLTNLERVVTKEGSGSTTVSYQWRANLPVLERDLSQILMPLPSPGSAEGQAMGLQPVRDVPTLFVFGDRSPYYSQGSLDRVRAYFPDAEVEVVQDAGHFVHYEQTDRFVEAVVPFMQRYL